MTTRVALGHEVFNAVVVPAAGRLIVVGEGYWQHNTRVGYAGFDGLGVGDTRYQADSRRTLQAMVVWLTGKTTGADILVIGTGAETDYQSYGSQFAAALTAYGHNVTWTGTLSGWSGWEPLDFDLLCGTKAIPAFDYHGILTAQGKFDYVLENNGKVLWCGITYSSAYGFDGALTGHPTVNVANHRIHMITDGPAVGADAPGWRYQRPFTCAQFGDPGVGGSWGTNLYALVMYTTGYVEAGVNTKGGSTALIECGLEQYGVHVTPATGTLGLWWA